MKAKYSFRILYFVLPCLPLLLLAIQGILGYFFDYNLFEQKFHNKTDHFYALLLGAIPCWLIFLVLSFKLKLSSIDGSSQKIVIKDTLTRRARSYSFFEVDGYEDTVKRYMGKGAGESFKALRIIKDKKVLATADSFFYSNLDELRRELNSLKYLGINIDWAKDKF